MSIEFRYASFDDYPRISRFLDQYWAKDHVYVRLPQLFDWTFGRTGVWDQDGYSFAMAEEKGEIVGILGAIPFTFNCLGKTSPAVWTANYMVRQEYRAGSVGLRLLRMVWRPPYDAVVSFGITQSVTPLHRLLRWRVMEEIPRHFMVLPDAQENMTSLLRLAQPDWTEDRARNLAHAFTLPRVCPASAPDTKALPLNWDDRDWPAIAARTVGAARTLDYLTWRYVEHPVFQYRCIGISDGKRTGLLIWRLETIRSVTPQAIEDIGRLGRVVEFLPTDPSNAQRLLAVFTHELWQAQALGADFYGYHGESRHWLEEFGFRSVERHPDGRMIPSRFQPLDRRGGSIRSAFFVHDDVPLCSSDADCSWYWTKSDADQDRPN